MSIHTTLATFNDEWEDIRDTPASWGDEGLTLGMALESIRFNPDCVLLDLIRHCQAGHDTAGRVIIQAMMGKLVLLANSRSIPLAALASAMWVRIGNYPVERRITSVAANLALDSLRDHIREQRVLRPMRVEPLDTLEALSVVEAARELELATDATLSILTSVYVHGLTGRQTAAVHNISEASVRRRCCDAVKRLRRHRNELIDALNLGNATLWEETVSAWDDEVCVAA